MKFKTRIILWAVKHKVRREVRRIRKESDPMAKFLNWLQRANILLAIGQGLSVATGAFPGLAGNPYVLVAQAVLGVLLPSVDGISHKLAYGEEQDPSKR